MTTDYPRPHTFNGTINWVEIAINDVAQDDDHIISPEERFRIAMARQ